MSTTIDNVLIARAEFSYTKIYQIVMYAVTPAYFLGSFPYIKLAAGLWVFVLVIIGYKILCRVSYVKSAFIVVTPFAIFIGAISAILFLPRGEGTGRDGIVEVRPTVITVQESDAALKSGPSNPMALFTAAERGDIVRAKELLADGADPNAKTHFGHYPLHEASSSGNTNMVELLLANGAKVDVRVSPKGPRSPNQWTPLLSAVYSGRKAVVQILISKGADVNSQDVWGNRPLYYARDRGHTEIIELLQAKGATE